VDSSEPGGLSQIVGWYGILSDCVWTYTFTYSSAPLKNTKAHLGIRGHDIKYSTELLQSAREGTSFMTKVIEILFRKKWGLLALLLLPILLSLAVAYKLPRQYQATAGLWALRRYEIIGATGPETDLTSTPAQTQATTLSELLQSRSFALAVAYDTDLPRALAPGNPGTQNLQDALYTEISTNVTATPLGYNRFSITYTNNNPAIALQVVEAVVKHYGTESASQSTAEGNQLLNNYEVQLASAQRQAQADTQAAAHYLQSTQLTLQQAGVDPQYQQLAAQVSEADAIVGTVETEITTIKQQLATLSLGSAGEYIVIDAPTVPNRPVSRTKTFLLGGSIGLIVGLLAAVMYFLILYRMDLLLYSLADVHLSTSYPVLVQIPMLSSPHIAKDSQSKGRLFASKVLPKWGR
jgi:uncharacterized protein involved in exopolysaccharide biosynthesis